MKTPARVLRLVAGGLLLPLIGSTSVDSFGDVAPFLWPDKVAQVHDNVPFSRMPPGGLSSREVPQFVVLGTDDATDAGMMNYFARDLFAGRFNPAGAGSFDTYDGAPVRGTFYTIGQAEGCGPDIVEALRELHLAGHEIGNHAYTDGDRGLTANGWRQVITMTNRFITGPLEETTIIDSGCGPKPRRGLEIPYEQVYGFRTPGDAYNEALFPVLQEAEINLYHCSTVQGHGSQGMDGTDLYWPGTLDTGIPYATSEAGVSQTGSHPGLWEAPQNLMMLPESIQQKYGFTSDRIGYCDGAWFWKNPNYTEPLEFADVTEILKYNLDLHYGGNRAPLHLCLHAFMPWSEGRRQVFRDFLDYAIGLPDVRVVRTIDVITWMRNPVSLGATRPPIGQEPTSTADAPGSASKDKCGLLGAEAMLVLGILLVVTGCRTGRER
ncbi:MAG: hypothetical protein HYY16_15375 [Planctomycetes bacterium]|nr:hypothetical protein [Planctomycetota bacterium]